MLFQNLQAFLSNLWSQKSGTYPSFSCHIILFRYIEKGGTMVIFWLVALTILPAFFSSSWHIVLLCQILVWLVAILTVIWLDVTLSSLACPLPATVVFVICHFSAFLCAVALAWKQALYANPQSFHAVLFSCKTWQNMLTCLSCCTSAMYIWYYFFDNSVLTCSLFFFFCCLLALYFNCWILCAEISFAAYMSVWCWPLIGIFRR